MNFKTVYSIGESPYSKKNEAIHHKSGMEMDQTLGFVYEKSNKLDTLLIHGNYEFILNQFEKIKKTLKGDIRIVKVPKGQYKWLNTCINISASKWCSQAESFLNNLS